MQKALSQITAKASQVNQEATKQGPEQVYSTAKEFLDSITEKINVYESIYKCVNVFVLPTTTIEDEYVVLVLEIMSEDLRSFYGGRYLIQQWSQKQKIFQAVHTNEPQSFFLHQQRFIYSLKGFDNECEYLYISNFYQNIFQKIKHPFFSKDHKNGIHDVSLYVDPKQVLIVDGEKIMWTQLKIENLMTRDGGTSQGVSALDFHDIVPGFTQIVESDVAFYDVLENCTSTEKPDDIQSVHFVCSEGYLRKEVQFVVATMEKIYVLQFNVLKSGGLKKAEFEVSHYFSFEKQAIEIGIMDKIDSISLQNYADQENLVVIHLASGQLKVYNESIQTMMEELKKQVKAESESESTDEEERARRERILAQRQKFCYRVTRSCRKEEVIPESRKKQREAMKNQALSNIKNFFQVQIKKSFFSVDKFFLRRQMVYFVGTNGEIKRININQIQNADATQKSQKISYPIQVAMLQDVILHINLYNDFLMANTTLILSHQKILSIYDFLTKKWRHMLPQEQKSSINQEVQSSQTYFGMPGDEIEQLVLNYVYSNNIYDCIIRYKGQFIRRLKYYNQIDKQYFERVRIFESTRVLQIQRNVDIKNYRNYGDSTIRTLFLVEDLHQGVHQIWVSENASRITKLVDKISLDEQWQLVEIPNASSDMLTIYSKKKRTMTIFNIANCKQCLYPQQLQKYITHEVERFDYDANQKIQYFLFGSKMYYQSKGNLMVLDLTQKTIRTDEINFNNTIKDLYMTNEDSIYFKDKNNIFRFAHIGIQKIFNVDKQPTEVTNCRGAFCTKIEYGPSTNRIALFTSSFEISVYPLLDSSRLDLIASQDFEANFICWKEIGNKLVALKKPNVLVTWNLDTGKIESYHTLDNMNFNNYIRHTEWNGATLLKQLKEVKVTEHKRKHSKKKSQARAINDDDMSDDLSVDYTDEDEKQDKLKEEVQINPNHHLYELIEIKSPTEIVEHCQFYHEFTPGVYLYVSFPYMLVMDEFCTKQYVIEGKNKIKTIRLLNTFYEPQMKVGRPIYFSPNFYHRLFIDPQTKEIIINFTLTNANIFSLQIRKEIMFQIEKTHPMIYFHDDNSIVYLTVHGVEKIFKIEKIMGHRRRKASCQLVEISNVFYNNKQFVRRFIIDPLCFNDQTAAQMNRLDILKFRSDILKRHLYFNIYLNSNSEDESRDIPRHFYDKNISSFSHFIINNYRQEMTFNYLTWKIIEFMGKKKIQLKDFKPDYIQELCYCVLPDNRNILHLLSENFDVLDSFIQYVNNENLEEIHQEDVEMTDIIFAPDLIGKTPLHYAIEVNNTRVVDKLVRSLAKTEFDHHSRFILDIYAKLVEIVPQSMSLYLQYRMKTPTWLTSYTRGRIEPENDCDFVMTADQIWKEGLNASLESKMYKPEALEVPLEMYILDLPHLHKYENNHADYFLEALADTDMIEIFSNNAVKALIELKWPIVRTAIKRFLFYPYLIFLLSFLVYTVYIFEEYYKTDDSTTSTTDSTTSTDSTTNSTLLVLSSTSSSASTLVIQEMMIVKTMIIIFTTYFFLIECRQMLIAGPLKYLASPWNYLDVIPLVLIMCSMFFFRLGVDPIYERPLNAIACFFMWIKFLYFWRIFRSTSKFISMIVSIIVDLKVFLVVFLVTLIAFGQSLYIMSNNNESYDDLIASGVDADTAASEARFINSLMDSVFFAYRMSLGDFDTSALGNTYKTLVIIMFVLATLFLTIMMLNILIAVISDSYARVESTSIEEMYKNMADLIAENEYLVRKRFLQAHDLMGDYLFIAKLDKTEGEDEMGAKLSEIQNNIVKKTELIEKILKEAQRSLSNTILTQSEQFMGYLRDINSKYDVRLKQCLKKVEMNSRKGGKQLHKIDSEGNSYIRSPDRSVFMEKKITPVEEEKANIKSPRNKGRKTMQEKAKTFQPTFGGDDHE